MGHPLKVLLVSSEVAPFAKTGGLADVSGALPLALKRLGIDVRVALPYYRAVKEGPFEVACLLENLEIRVGHDVLRDDVYVTSMKGDIPVYLINKDEYFDRRSLYGTSKGDYFDNLERFVYFSKALFLLCKRLPFAPDVIHSNDWQTGLVPAYLQSMFRKTSPFVKTASLFTIHNLAYQGLFPGEKFHVTGLPEHLFAPHGIEFWGRINLLKSGILFSDIVTTVSRQYSKEIQTPEFGYGLDGVLRNRREDLFGVVNGVDYGEWAPERDPLIAAHYSVSNLDGKERCKEDLLALFHLPEALKTQPVIGVISRLVSQKGFDLLAGILDELMKEDLGLIVLGTGDPVYEQLFLQAAQRYPRKVAVKITYDNPLAHKIEAGADMFLMPSRYEPCGLNQIYSLKYGTVPIVRATGGLEDTIVDYDIQTERGTGFKFRRYQADDLLRCIRGALSVYQDRKRWERLMHQGMEADFSWERPARRYLSLYKRAIREAADRSVPPEPGQPGRG
jgi:starch synthase